jgi:hypothetical protein
MRADKVTVTIKMESLSVDTLRGMISQVAEQVESGAESGHLEMQDGDRIEWSTVRKPVEF